MFVIELWNVGVRLFKDFLEKITALATNSENDLVSNRPIRSAQNADKWIKILRDETHVKQETSYAYCRRHCFCIIHNKRFISIQEVKEKRGRWKSNTI